MAHLPPGRLRADSSLTRIFSEAMIVATSSTSPSRSVASISSVVVNGSVGASSHVTLTQRPEYSGDAAPAAFGPSRRWMETP